MPKVYLNNGERSLDITGLVADLTWSGSSSEVARSLDLSLVFPLHDHYTPKVYPKIGNLIVVQDDAGVELFSGRVFTNERTNEQGTIKITCFDPSIRLSKSTGTFNFKNQTAESMTKAVCDEIGLPVGTLASTGINQKMLCQNMGLFNIIEDAYSGASVQNKKRYLPMMVGGKFNVYEVGKVAVPYTLSDSTNIISSSYSEDAGNMVNRVKIYDENDKYLGMVQDEKLSNALGVFQQVYTKEEDKQAKTVATNMLNGIEQAGEVTCIGDTSLISGKAVEIKDSATNISGIFWIESDSHTWSNGQYTTVINLTFKQIKE